MARYLIPFTGGINSLYSLGWALSRNVQPHLLYVSNLFAHNGSDIEQQSVRCFAQNLRDWSGNYLWSPTVAGGRHFEWNLVIFTIPLHELAQLQTNFHRFAYLAGLSSKVARDRGCTSVVWDPSTTMTDGTMEIDVKTLEQRTGVQFVFPTYRNNYLDFLFSWYTDTMSGHEEQESSDQNNADFDEQTTDEDPHRFLGNFDSDFPFWQTIACCRRSMAAQQADLDDCLPNLCRKCQRCVDVRSFIENMVDEFMPAVNEVSQDLQSSEITELCMSKRRKIY
jgi:hypothetical protein